MMEKGALNCENKVSKSKFSAKQEHLSRAEVYRLVPVVTR